MSVLSRKEKLEDVRRRIVEAKQDVENCELALGNARLTLQFWLSEQSKIEVV